MNLPRPRILRHRLFPPENCCVVCLHGYERIENEWPPMEPGFDCKCGANTNEPRDVPWAFWWKHWPSRVGGVCIGLADQSDFWFFVFHPIAFFQCRSESQSEANP